MLFLYRCGQSLFSKTKLLPAMANTRSQFSHWLSAPELEGPFLQNALTLTFKPIDFSKHSDIADEFRHASKEIDPHFKMDTVRNVLADNIYVHVWNQNKIVGQLELDMHDTRGYVNLCYLIPSYRNKGLFKALTDFMCSTMKEHEVHMASLSVSRSNIQAIKACKSEGWIPSTDTTQEGDRVMFTMYPFKKMKEIECNAIDPAEDTLEHETSKKCLSKKGM